jgi:hypothetical protein
MTRRLGIREVFMLIHQGKRFSSAGEFHPPRSGASIHQLIKNRITDTRR